MLNKLLEHNDQVVLTPSALTRFHSRAPPGISVLDYLKRIVKYTNLEVSPWTFPFPPHDETSCPPIELAKTLCAYSNPLDPRLAEPTETPPPLPPSLHRHHMHQPSHFYSILPDRPPVRHLGDNRRFESPLRRLLYQRPLCQSRRDQGGRVERAREGVSEGDGLGLVCEFRFWFA